MSTRGHAIGQKNTQVKTHAEAATIAKRNAWPLGLRQWGMRITVFNDGGSTGDYVLVYGLSSTSKSDNANWQKVADIDATWGGGGGSSYTFTNGITETGGTAKLGDALTESTTIDTDGFDFIMQTVKSGSPGNKFEFRVEATNLPNYTFSRIRANEFYVESKSVSTAYGYIQQSLSSFNVRSFSATRTVGISLSAVSGGTVFDSGNFPLRYNQDNTANLSNSNDIPHLGYVDSTLGGNALDALIISPTVSEHGQSIRWNNTNLEYEFYAVTTFVNGLTESGGVASLGGVLTSAVSIDGITNGVTFSLQSLWTRLWGGTADISDMYLSTTNAGLRFDGDGFQANAASAFIQHGSNFLVVDATSNVAYFSPNTGSTDYEVYLDGRTKILSSSAAAYTLTELERGKTLLLSNAAPVVTLSGSVATGYQVAIQYTGTPGAGISFTGYTTLESVGGADTVVDQFGWVYLVHKGGNVWAASGNLT